MKAATGERTIGTRAAAVAPRPPMPPLRIAAIVFNHLVPLIGTLWLNWPVGQFVLLSLINVVFGIMGPVTANLVVDRLQQAPQAGVTGWLSVEPWVSLCLVVVFFSGVLAVLFGWIALALMPHGALAERHLWISAGLMVAAALPGLVAGAHADLRSGAGEGARMARDQPAILLQVASGIALLVLSGYAADWFGAAGLYPLLFALTAFFIFRDLRPEAILRQLFPGY